MNFGCLLATSNKLLVVVIGITLLNIDICYGLIPKICALQATQRNPECCPSIQGIPGACGGPLRGECRDVEPVVGKQPLEDIRQFWPKIVFNRLCVCKGRFDGVACETCKPGWTGSNCDIRTVHIRRNIATYSSTERELLLKILHLSSQIESDFVIFKEGQSINYGGDPNNRPVLKPATVEEALVFIHAYVSPPRCDGTSTADFAHNGETFILWHRAFMIFWEKELQKIAFKYFGVLDFTVPYWDWTDETECKVCRNELAGGEGEWDQTGHRLHPGSIFRYWREYCSPFQVQQRCVICHDEISPVPFITREWTIPKFPTSEEVAYALSMPRFDHPNDQRDTPCFSFHTAAEGTCTGNPGLSPGYLHNYVHNVVNGTFRSTYTSPNDPMFIFHHAQLDRLFSRWFRQAQRYPTDLPESPKSTGHCRDCYLVGLLPLVKALDMYQDCRNLGYDYDNYSFGRIR